MTNPANPSHNQPPTPERANHDQLETAFGAVEREVQLSGKVDYRTPLEATAEEWVNEVLVQYVDSQAHTDLDQVEATDILGRLSDEERESLAAIGITTENAEDKSILLSFARECYEKDAEGRSRFAPASAVVVVTTAFPNGGLEIENYEILNDRTGEKAKLRGGFSRDVEMGEVSMFDEVAKVAKKTEEAEERGDESEDDSEERLFSETDVALRGIVSSQAPIEDGKRNIDPTGLDPTAIIDAGTRYSEPFLTPAQVAAIHTLAERYSS